MACYYTSVTSLSKLCTRQLCNVRHAKNVQIVPKRTVSVNSSTITGTIPPEPAKKRFSSPLVIACMFVGTYCGQYSAKRFAAFMEETELFVPEDDDD